MSLIYLMSFMGLTDEFFQKFAEIFAGQGLPPAVLRIRIRDSGSGIRCLLDPRIRDPGSEIGLFRIPDPGSRIPDPGSQTHIFESLVTTFWVKSSIIL
jgi:hypothetical protein